MRTERTVLGTYLGEPVGDLHVLPGNGIEGTRVEAAELPLIIDEVPVLAALAAYAKGRSLFAGAAELRTKESDRLGGLAVDIRALGGLAEVEGDDLLVAGGGLTGGAVDALRRSPHGDGPRRRGARCLGVRVRSRGWSPLKFPSLDSSPRWRGSAPGSRVSGACAGRRDRWSLGVGEEHPGRSPGRRARRPLLEYRAHVQGGDAASPTCRRRLRTMAPSWPGWPRPSTSTSTVAGRLRLSRSTVGHPTKPLVRRGSSRGFRRSPVTLRFGLTCGPNNGVWAGAEPWWRVETSARSCSQKRTRRSSYWQPRVSAQHAGRGSGRRPLRRDRLRRSPKRCRRATRKTLP